MNVGTFRAVDGVPYVRWWCERFGAPPGAFADLGCYQRGKSSVWIGRHDLQLHGLTTVDGVGLPFLRIGRADWKTTNAAAVRFGHLATRRLVEIDAAELAAVLRGETVALPPADPRLAACSRGHVIVRYAGAGVGCARVQDGELRSEIPRGRQLATADLPD